MGGSPSCWTTSMKACASGCNGMRSPLEPGVVRILARRPPCRGSALLQPRAGDAVVAAQLLIAVVQRRGVDEAERVGALLVGSGHQRRAGRERADQRFGDRLLARAGAPSGRG